MSSGGSLGRAGRELYLSLRHSRQAWVPFFPPFTQEELPTPRFAAKNPLMDDRGDWTELLSDDKPEQSLIRLATGLLVGVVLIAATVLGFLLYPLDQNVPSLSALLPAGRNQECSCEEYLRASANSSPYIVSRGIYANIQIDNRPELAASGTVGLLLQTTQVHPSRCVVLAASPEVEAWGWSIEGRLSEANATRTGDGKHFCLKLSDPLPWPAAYLKAHFRYTPPAKYVDATTGHLNSPLVLSTPQASGEGNNQPFAVFPFFDNRKGESFDSSLISLWEANVTSPTGLAVEASVDGLPLFNSGQMTRSGDFQSLTYLFSTTTASMPKLLLKQAD